MVLEEKSFFTRSKKMAQLSPAPTPWNSLGILSSAQTCQMQCWLCFRKCRGSSYLRVHFLTLDLG